MEDKMTEWGMWILLIGGSLFLPIKAFFAFREAFMIGFFADAAAMYVFMGIVSGVLGIYLLSILFCILLKRTG